MSRNLRSINLFWNEPAVCFTAVVRFADGTERINFNKQASDAIKNGREYRLAVRAVAVQWGRVLAEAEIQMGESDGGWAQWNEKVS